MSIGFGMLNGSRHVMGSQTRIFTDFEKSVLIYRPQSGLDVNATQLQIPVGGGTPKPEKPRAYRAKMQIARKICPRIYPRFGGRFRQSFGPS